MSEKRKRAQNFTAEEKDRLVKLLNLHRETILNKKTDGTTNEAKNKAWIEVTNAFNSSATIYRTRESLMKIWEKLKTESKLYYQTTRQCLIGTGGGPAEIKTDPILEEVCALLGRACTGIVGVQDSDAGLCRELEYTLPKKICVTAGPSQQLSDNLTTDFLCSTEILEQERDQVNISLLENDTGNSEPTKDALHENPTIIKTPLWSRRRPQFSHINERTDAVSSLCSSYKSVNKKKEDIEELKRQLLQEEIDFKRKLYELQLKAAMKDIEIKTEVLNQLKGGNINMQQLLGESKKS